MRNISPAQSAHGRSDRLCVRCRRGNRRVTLRPTGAACGAVSWRHRRTSAATRRCQRPGAVIHVRDSRARLCDLGAGTARQSAANAFDHRPDRLWHIATRAVARRSTRGTPQPYRTQSGYKDRRTSRWRFLVWHARRRRPGFPLRTVRGSNPRRGDNCVGVAELHRRAAGCRPRLRHRLGHCAVWTDARGTQGHGQTGAPQRTLSDVDGRDHGGYRVGDARQLRHAL